MSMFKPASNTQAFLKAGFLGFQGAGKTFTAGATAIGLVQMLKEKKLPTADKPVFFLDSETGSDYLREQFEKAGIPLHSFKTRAFADLLGACDEAEKDSSVLIIDSVTHYWRDLCDAYQKARNKRRLEFQDWNYLKGEWGKFSVRYVNSPVHMIVCGRAGFEYDFQENEDGKKDLVKTGIKMKTEGEFGFEPSLLVLMEREVNVETKAVTRTAYVLKDRFDVIDGKEFTNPTVEAFMPHIQRLNLGGEHLGFDSTRTTKVDVEGKPDWQRERKQAVIVLDEIGEVLKKHYPGTAKEMVQVKSDLLEKFGGTRSWARVETFKLSQLIELRNKLWLNLEGVEYTLVPVPPIDSEAAA
jgi:hypothetical protein